MACCGPSIKKPSNPEELLKKLRNFEDREIQCNLNKNKMTFKPIDGRWKTNFLQLPNPMINVLQKEIVKHQKISAQQDDEIDNLEKIYLAKIAKLLVMTQVHCEIKTFIQEEFDRLGISVQTKEREKLIEEDVSSEKDNNNIKNVDNNFDGDDENNQLIDNNNNEEKKEMIELV
jgi:hypothetical protein